MADYISPVFSTGEEVDEALTAGLNAYDGLSGKQDALSSAQLAAVNSGISTALVSQIGTNATDISTLQSGKVDVESGKQLSTNDYTNEEKQELLALIDGGAKNHATITDFTATLWQQIPIEPIGGTIHLHIGGYSSTDTDTTTFLANFQYSDGTTSGKSLTKGAVDVEYDLANYTLTRIDIYASDNWNHSSGDDVTVSELMVCSKAAWDISQTYQPYRPSYQELYERILALEGGGTASLMANNTNEINENESV